MTEWFNLSSIPSPLRRKYLCVAKAMRWCDTAQHYKNSGSERRFRLSPAGAAFRGDLELTYQLLLSFLCEILAEISFISLWGQPENSG